MMGPKEQSYHIVKVKIDSSIYCSLTIPGVVLQEVEVAVAAVVVVVVVVVVAGNYSFN
jgi:hypothetical protein